MFHIFHHPDRHTGHRLVLACLALAIALYGWSALAASLLGTRHIHSEAVERSAAVSPGQVHRGSRATIGLPNDPGRGHAVFERHHHGLDDASVISLDGNASGGTLSHDVGADTTGVYHVLAVTSGHALALPPLGALVWAALAPASVSRWVASSPDRPPKD